jgi:hypothetical protein
MQGKLRTVGLAGLGGIIGALAVGAIVSAGASDVSDVGHGDSGPVAAQEVGAALQIGDPVAAAGGDVTANGVAAGDFTPAGGGKASGGGGAASSSAVNSSGNSANTNTNAQAVNNQIGLDQETVAVQANDNTSSATATQAQEQAEEQGQDQTSEQTNVQLTVPVFGDLVIELVTDGGAEEAAS